MKYKSGVVMYFLSSYATSIYWYNCGYVKYVDIYELGIKQKIVAI